MTFIDFAPSVRKPAHRQTATPSFRPATNVLEEKDAYIIQLMVPGYSREEMKVSLEKGILTVSATPNGKQPAAKFQRKEFMPKAFARQFRLPEDIDQEALAASQENGVLQIRIPKAESAKPRSIKVA
jgi:HSP20 family protein